MFPSFDSDLHSEAEKWQMIETSIDLAIAADVNATQLMRELRDSGFKFGDSAFRELYRDKAGFAESFSYPTRLRRDVSFNPERLPESSYSLTGDYGYIGSVEYFDAQLNRMVEKTYRVDSDNVLSRNEVEQQLLNLGLKNYPWMVSPQTIVTYKGAMRNAE